MIGKILCPYCFRYFGISDCHWRCVNERCCSPGDTVPGEIDTLFTGYQEEFGLQNNQPGQPDQNQQRRMLRAFPNTTKRSFTRAATTATCDWCQRVTTKRLCSHCHNELPFNIESSKNHIIAIIGAKEVGKTHFIAVLIQQLRQQVGASFSMSLLELNDATALRYRNEFYNPLYNGKRCLDTSQSMDLSPLMYRLTIEKGGLIKTKSAVSLVFFDTAGENFDDDSRMRAWTRYLSHASGVILLVDPLQMSSVRNRLEGAEVRMPKENTEPTDIIARLVRQLQTQGGLDPKKLIDIPLAVCFTKADALRDYGILQAGNAVYSQPRHEKVLSKKTVQQINDELHASLVSWAGPDLDNRLRAYFKNYVYCCVSALGESPDQNNKVTSISPFRVEDPFLWLLSQIGQVQAV